MISRFILFVFFFLLPHPWSVCAVCRPIFHSGAVCRCPPPRCKQKKKQEAKFRRVSHTRVLLCLAVTYWLLGLSVIWPARRQLCRPSPRLRRRSQRKQTSCEHLLGSLPPFPFLLPSRLSSLATSSPESVTAFSFIHIYPPHHHHPLLSLPGWPPLCLRSSRRSRPITVTAEQRCWETPSGADLPHTRWCVICVFFAACGTDWHSSDECCSQKTLFTAGGSSCVFISHSP